LESNSALSQQLQRLRTESTPDEVFAFLEENIERIFSTPDVYQAYQVLQELDVDRSPRLLAKLIVAWMAFLCGDNARLSALLAGVREAELDTPQVSSLFYALKALVSGMMAGGEAERYAQLALDILPANEVSIYMANAQLTYGQILAGREQYHRAAEMFSAAQGNFQQRRMPFPAMIALVNELLNRFHLGEVADVVDKCNQALLMSASYQRRTGDYWDVVHLPLGMCYYQLHRPHLAIDHLQKCITAVNRPQLLHLHGLIEVYLFKSLFLARDQEGMCKLTAEAIAQFGHLNYPQMDQLLSVFRILSAPELTDELQLDVERLELCYQEALQDGFSLVPEALVWLRLKGQSQLVQPGDLLPRLKRFRFIGNIPQVQLTELQLAELYLQAGQSRQASRHLQAAVQIYREYGISACFGSLPLGSAEMILRLDSELYHRILQVQATALAEARSAQGSAEAVLSPREREIVQLMAAGKSNQEISQELFISVGTIKWHINRIFSKLQAKNRVQAIEKAKALREIVV
jgi:LuxR family maltose regulon positive regulatory protein